jgi:hypothetical protein
MGGFQVNGSGLLWDGHEYVRYNVNSTIPAFAVCDLLAMLLEGNAHKVSGCSQFVGVAD